MVRIAVIDDYQSVAEKLADWDSLPAGTQVDFYQDHVSDLESLVDRLGDYQIIQFMRERTPFTKNLIDALPQLELLSGTGGNFRSFDIEAATERGVLITRSGGAGSSTEELAWGLILSVARCIPQEDRAMREGRWQTQLGVGLSGRKLGVIGMGRLGSRVARIGQAFGMELLAWSPWQTVERAAENNAKYLPREQFFSQADVITIHIPLTEESVGLVNAQDLKNMKSSAYLINTARGPIVNETDLVEALQAGSIAGAGLDVFDEEPLPSDHPLLKVPNTVLTPHIGFVSEESYRAFYTNGLDNIKAYLAGNPTNMVNPEALEHRKG
ncbi:MAG: D-2-hydroxyacid dehydrogenase family protein [Chloroflexota bacterium]|nr:D-2-hydroxyacid dehydrogenase family protein [Chloroflexota bacterium]